MSNNICRLLLLFVTLLSGCRDRRYDNKDKNQDTKDATEETGDDTDEEDTPRALGDRTVTHTPAQEASRGIQLPWAVADESNSAPSNPTAPIMRSAYTTPRTFAVPTVTRSNSAPLPQGPIAAQQDSETPTHTPTAAPGPNGGSPTDRASTVTGDRNRVVNPGRKGAQVSLADVAKATGATNTDKQDHANDTRPLSVSLSSFFPPDVDTELSSPDDSPR